MRIILFTGKGGVGKTTLSAAMALKSASLGYKTLIVSTDVAHSLADAFQVPLGNAPRPIGGELLWASELDTAEELERVWGDLRRRIASLLQKEGVSAPIAGELAILPGLDEILALARLKRFHDERRYDVLIIDSAPTGAAMRLLGAPDLQRWYTRNLLGFSRGLGRALIPAVRNAFKVPALSDALIQEQLATLFEEIEALRALLTDGARTSVRLVLNPEHLSLQETERAFTYFSLFGLSVDALFVNRILPDAVYDPFFSRWKDDQAHYLARIREAFAPLPTFEVPLRPQEVVGVKALEALAEALFTFDPVPPLSEERPLRFFSQDGHHMLALRAPGLSAGAVELEKEGCDLHIRLGAFRRSIVLPQYLGGLKPSWARLEGNELLIAFEEPA